MQSIIRGAIGPRNNPADDTCIDAKIDVHAYEMDIHPERLTRRRILVRVKKKMKTRNGLASERSELNDCLHAQNKIVV